MQVVGIFAVVASLIFVGLQLKQSLEIAISEQYSLRATEEREVWENHMEYQELRAINGAVHREHLKSTLFPYFGDDVADETIGLWYATLRGTIAAWDNNHYQYESGFMSDDGWSIYAVRILAGCKFIPGVRIILSNHADIFRPSFVEYCMQAVDAENESPIE
jgi:hypothetical protein